MSQSFVLRAVDPRLGTLTGVRDNGLIKLLNSPAGIALHGGYARLPAGRYRAIIWLSETAPADGQGSIEICVGLDAHTVNRIQFDTTSLSQSHPFIEIAFELFRPSVNVEVRLHGMAGLTLEIERVEFIALSSEGDTAKPPLPAIKVKAERVTTTAFASEVINMSPADHAVLRSPRGKDVLTCSQDSLISAKLGKTYPIVNGTPHICDAADVSPLLIKDFARFKALFENHELRGPDHEIRTAAYQSAKYINSEFMFSALDYAHLAQRKVLELGVASADLLRRFADMGCTAYALDYYPWEMEQGLAEHIKSGGMPFKCVSAVMCCLPFADASFDLLYLHAALHHALPADSATFEWSNPRNLVDCLREIRRTLKPDGMFLLLGEGIYPEGVQPTQRQYERACQSNPELPYESWYTISEYETAFKESGIFPNLFVYQENLTMVINIYEPSGLKHAALTIDDDISHHNYASIGDVLRANVPGDVLDRALPNWAKFR